MSIARMKTKLRNMVLLELGEQIANRLMDLGQKNEGDNCHRIQFMLHVDHKTEKGGGGLGRPALASSMVGILREVLEENGLTISLVGDAQ